MAASPLYARPMSPSPRPMNASTGRAQVARPAVPAKKGVIEKVLGFFTGPAAGPAPRSINPNNATYTSGNPGNIREVRALSGVVNGRNGTRSSQAQLVPDQALVSFLDNAFLR